MRTVRVSLDDSVKPPDLDMQFKMAWMFRQKIRFEMDATQCRNVSLKRILSMKEVLDFHRPNSKKYIDHTVVFVKSRVAQFALRAALLILRTERPVYIKLAKKPKW